MSRVVTIDGPAGSGKTTLGRRLAAVLGLPLVDTGLFYRGVTVAAARAGIDIDDAPALIACALRTQVVVRGDAEADTAIVDGLDAGPALRDPAHAGLLARMSSIPEVRAALLDAQRAAAARGAVAVGRDCGTVVFPDAQLKLYLEAPESVRAQRRARQLTTDGAVVDTASLIAEVRGRDRVDTSRAAAPLRPARDARIINTDRLGVEAMVAQALSLCADLGLVPA